MKTYVLKTAQAYDAQQNLIPANKLDWQVDKSQNFDTYDEANVARISAQAMNDRMYISVAELNK